MKILTIQSQTGTFQVGEFISNQRGILSNIVTIGDKLISVNDPVLGRYRVNDIITGSLSGATATIIDVRDNSILDISALFGGDIPSNFKFSDFIENLAVEEIDFTSATDVPAFSSTKSIDGNITAYQPPTQVASNPANPTKEIPAQPQNNPNIPIGNEPTKQYVSEYPYNKVYNSEGGHLIEVDDTPGNERLLNKHVSGTYNQMHADGDYVTKVIKDNYTIVAGDDSVSIEGKATVHISGDCSLIVGSGLTIVADGGINFITRGDFRVKAKSINLEATSGDFSVKTSGNSNITTGESTNINSKQNFIESLDNTNIKSGELLNVGSKKTSIHSTTGTIISSDAETSISATDLFLSSDGDTNIKSSTTKITSNSIEADAKLNVKNTTNMKAGGTDVIGYGAASASASENTAIQPEPAATCSGSGISYSADPDKFLEMTDDDEEASAAAIKQAIANGTLNPEDLNTPTTESGADNTPVTDSKATLLAPTVPNLGSASPADNMRLTQHFTVGKLSKFTPVCAHIVTAQHGLSTTQLTGNLQLLAQNCLEPILAKFPDLRVTNAFRVAGNKNSKPGKISQHEKGQAADMQFASANSNKDLYFEIAKWIKDNVPFDQLLLEYKTFGTKLPWIHISYNQSGNRKQVLTMKNNSTYKQGLVNLRF